MKQSQVAYWLWSVGTVLIVLSWFGLVSPSVGWGGFVAALVGSVISFVRPTKNNKASSERDQALEKLRQRQELAGQLQEMSRQNLERQSKLLEKWEEQARRMDAILTKWEQR